MTTTKKLIVAVVALSLALTCAIGITLAFLIDSTEKVVNTFTYGKVDIDLWENEVDANGALTDVKDHDGIEYLNVVPGDTVNKNPTITVETGSEDCYIYALVTNNLISTADPAVSPVATIAFKAGWVAIGTSGNSTLYRYTTSAQTVGDYVIFDKVTFNGNLKVADINSISEIEEPITIKAYAHQAENTNMATADEAAIAWAGVTAIVNN